MEGRDPAENRDTPGSIWTRADAIMVGVGETRTRTATASGFAALAALCGMVVLVVFGLARGIWLPNLHNGLLALACSGVGTYVIVQRPRHRLGRLLLATGAAEAVMFAGRQIGHSSTSSAARWWGWLGVWPIGLTLALLTLCVLIFPDGRFPPSRRWRAVVVAVVSLCAVCVVLSAAWPVEYESAGLTIPHPWASATPGAVRTIWSAVAHPTYAAFQALWLVAAATRWRGSSGTIRMQLGVVAGAAAVAVIALVVGLIGWGSPTPGVLAATLLPVAAGWAVVRGRQLARYSALTWLSRVGSSTEDLASALTRAVAEALDVPSATLWVGDDLMHAVGVWPEMGQPIEPSSLRSLTDDPHRTTVPVVAEGRVIGALEVDRPDRPRWSPTDQRLLDDLLAQARFVIDHLGLAERAVAATADDRRRRLRGLTAREHDVLELMARGLSNAAICRELHISVKTVEPVVSSIFTKLDLPAGATVNRRVLAVVAYMAE
jgi:GAF domain-containing protein